MTDEQASESPLFGVAELNPQVLETYARLWQFETWLRTLVYVQLRAADGDAWESRIKAAKAKMPKDSDKRLSHMPTAEDGILSYLQLSELLRVIADNWSLFSGYLPPQSIWEAKLEEVAAIRHRIAHFRTLHRDDIARVKQFLRDIDAGFWRFCTSYNNTQPVLPQSNDPVVEHFLHLDQIPWGQTESGAWARIGSADRNATLNVTVEVLAMPWAAKALPIAGQPGYIYDVMIFARRERQLDYRQVMQHSTRLHQHVVHICVDSFAKQLRVTIPACLGAAKVTEIIEGFIEAATYSLRPALREFTAEDAQAFADTLPEYVLGPKNPLTFLSPDMPCSFFAV